MAAGTRWRSWHGRHLEITGIIENVKPYDVRIVAEGDDETLLEQFIARLQIKHSGFPWRLNASRCASRTLPVNEYLYFEIKRGDLVEEWGEKSAALGERSVELGDRAIALVNGTRPWAKKRARSGGRCARSRTRPSSREGQEETVRAV